MGAAGYAYVTGMTHSFDFPTKNSLQSAHGEGSSKPEPPDIFLGDPWDVFVTKLTPDGSALVFSTYFGGQGTDGGTAIALDGAENILVTGYAYSDGLATPGAFQQNISEGRPDAFVAKFDTSGAKLHFFTYLGGNAEDIGNAIVLDAAGQIHLAGYTSSPDFPTRDPIQATYGGGHYDAFVTKLTADASAVVYSTYVGGSSLESIWDLAVDAAGDLYLAGQTGSPNFATANALQPKHAGGDTVGPFDGFVAKISSADPRPALSIARSGSSVLVSWPTNALGFSLEIAAELRPPMAWADYPGALTVIGERHVAVEAASGAQKLYRLRKR